MKKKMGKAIKKLATMLVMAVVFFSSGKATVYAFVDETAQEPDVTITEEPPEEAGGTPFSVPGNGGLLDDITDDETKQFLTVQTKNGNTFFMVIDRSRSTENVYMLSLVDENNLAEFIEKEPEPEEEKPAVVLELPQPEPAAEESGAEPEKAGTGMGALLTMLLFGAGAVGGCYYFKIVKPRRVEEEAESEDLEFDDGACINEEGENRQEEEYIEE